MVHSWGVFAFSWGEPSPSFLQPHMKYLKVIEYTICHLIFVLFLGRPCQTNLEGDDVNDTTAATPPLTEKYFINI